jgi:flagellar biosynthesis anti-sigma factor FlgM
MMKELLQPMTTSGLSDEEEDAGSGGAMVGFASEALGRAVSAQGGFGIANRILADLSRSGTAPASRKVIGNLRNNLGMRSHEWLKSEKALRYTRQGETSMDIRSGLDGLKSLLGVTQPTPAPVQQNRGAAATEGNALGSDRATLSNAGSEVSQTAADGGVRMDKVSGIQAALAAGSYNIPAAAVASRMVDAMLAGGH